MSRQHDAARKTMLTKALSYPGAWEDHPWGETVVKVGKKIFVFIGRSETGFGCSLKLDRTGEVALTTFPWVSPTGYGLGKSGWITAHFEPKQDVPVPLLLEWMEESYRAIAPAKVATGAPQAKPAARSEAPATRAPVKSDAAVAKAPVKKTAAKKTAAKKKAAKKKA